MAIIGGFCQFSLHPKASMTNGMINCGFSIVRFHTEQNTWEDMPPVPGNLFNYCAMEMDGNIYIAGEYDQSPQAEHHESMVAIYRYSIMRREWKELPTRLANFQIASMTKSSDRRIILILKDLENLWVYRYNPVAGNSECDWVRHSAKICL